MSGEGSRRKKILVIKLSSLGDLLHALPAVHELKKAFGAEIHWVTQPGFRPIVECFDDVDQVLTFPRDHFFTSYPGFLRRLRRDRYDLVVDFQGLLKSALLVGRMARTRHRVGVPCGREGARYLYEAAPKALEGHAVERLLQVLEVLDLPRPDTPVFPISFPKVPYEEEKPRVAFVATSRWPAKDWPVEKFIEAGKRIQQERDAAVYLLGGPSDGDACRAMQKALPGRVVNLCGQTNLAQLGSVLSGMDTVLTVDSGPMHIAAALGVPVVAVFGVTDPRRTGPYGEGHCVLLADTYRDREDLPRLFKRDELAGTWDVDMDKVVEGILKQLGPPAG